MCKRKIIIFATLSLAFCFSPLFYKNVSALSEEKLYKNLLANTMSNCYFSSEMEKTVDVQNFESFKKNILKKGKGQKLFYIPTGIGVGNDLVGQKGEDTKIGCYELFLGGGTMDGMFEVFDKPEPEAQDANLEDNLVSLGYSDITSVADEASCIYANYSNADMAGGNNYSVGSVCWDEEDLQGNIITFADLNGGARFKKEKNSLIDMTLGTNEADSPVIRFQYKNNPLAYCSIDVGFPSNGEFYSSEDIKKSATKSCGGIVYYDEFTAADPINYEVGTRYELENSDSGGNSFAFVDVAMKSYGEAYVTAREYFTGDRNMHVFTVEEKYDLYSLYLSKVYGVEAVSGTECKASKAELGDSPIIEDADGTKKYYTYTNNGWCAVQGPKDALENKVVSVFNGNHFQLTKSVNFEELLEEIFSLKLDGVIENGLILDGDSSVSENNGSPEKEMDMCYKDAGALGWIICPVITTLADLLNNVYEDVEENYLKIPASELFGEEMEDSDIYKAWDAFRNIANTMFIILFLVVIFSQLTGRGIDNYGIKKILPRIIIAAVLINLSYVICQLAVDLSNIIGVGLRGIFDNIIPNTTGGYEANGAQYVVAFGGLGAIGLAALFISPGLIITVALALLSAAIAVLFLWIVLISRQVGVILIVALSPLAFACYILPNTDKFFKKWIDVVKGLLLLYPLCSLVVGGGSLAGRILSSIPSENESMRLAAMVVQVVPYFFIPTLLRGSLKALGNLGAGIQRLGRNFNTATAGRLARSEAVRRGRVALNNADPGGLRARVANTRVGRLTGFSRARARQIAAADKEREINLEAGKKLRADISDRQERRDPTSVTQARIQEQLNAAMNAGDESTYDAILDDSIRRFGDSKAAEMHRKAIVQAGSRGLMAANRKARFLRNSAERYKSFQTKDFGLGRFMLSGGVDKDGHAVDLETFDVSELRAGDLSDERAATLNANSIVRAMRNKNGLVSQVMAQRLMANKQARNQMDDVQQLIWAKYADDGTVITKDEAEAILSGRTTYTNETGAVQATSMSRAEATKLIQPLPEQVEVTGGSVNANVSGPVDVNVVNDLLNVQGTVNVGNEVDVTIRQSGEQINPVRVTQDNPQPNPPVIIGSDGQPLPPSGGSTS